MIEEHVKRLGSSKPTDKAVLKASLRDEKQQNHSDNDSDWESVEDDFPTVKLEELLDPAKAPADEFGDSADE